MPAVGDHGELDAGRAAVVEQRLDRGADGAAGVEHVVHEDDRAALEPEVEPGVADDRLRVARRLAAAHRDVVAVEGDIDRAEGDLARFGRALLDQALEPLRQRDAAAMDADERDLREILVALDDLVRDAGKRPPERFCVEDDLRRGEVGHGHCLLPGLSGPV